MLVLIVIRFFLARLFLARHSSESWNPAFAFRFQISEELDPSFRWDDGSH
jgi:hypothetical protein